VKTVYIYCYMVKNINLRANIALATFSFLVNIVGPCPVYAQAEGFILPAPGQMVTLSPSFSPAVLKGIKLDPKNPFRFHFFVDRGDSSLSQEELKSESSKLIKYFLASLTIPETDLWVNLSPYEKDRIVPQEFGQTEMGRDLLAEDYLLKQITASLIYPESQLGKEFWAKVYAQAQAKFGTTNIPVNTFNKVWIVPEKAVVYENGGVAFVLENHLKVMLEQDYLSLAKHEGIQSGLVQAKDTNQLGSQIIREIVIPALTKEVNEGKNFSQLRQVFYSLILATWYKKKIKDSILNKIYSNRNKIGGVNVSVGDKDKIYQEYLKAFKKGVYNYIKEEPTIISGQTIPRKYFSGGVGIAGHWDAAMNIKNKNQIDPDLLVNFAQESHLNEILVDATLISQSPKIQVDQAMNTKLKETPYGLLTNKQYEEKVGNALKRGLTYEEAQVWREAKIRTNLKLPPGFWSSPVTAKNMIYVALDTIPGFREAREANDIKTMTALIRKGVINYVSKDKKRFPINGPTAFLKEVGGLAGLLGNYNKHLSKKNSPGSLIRWAFPGLIDVRNPDALDPFEIEQDYWMDEDNAKYHIYLALDSMPGFEQARKDNNIKIMAELYRQYVIAYKAKEALKFRNGQLGFFYEFGKLSGLMATPKPFLNKVDSPASVVRFALPGLIDPANPDALNPLEVDSSYWDDPGNARERIFSALYTIDGFKSAHEGNNIKKMEELYRQFVNEYKAKDSEKFFNGASGFFEEVGGLRSLMSNERTFLDKINSPAALIRFVLPKLIDDDNPDALKTYEVEKGALDNPDYARKVILMSLDALPGFQLARSRRDIKTMGQIYREQVIGYKAVDKSRHPWDGQAAFWEEKAGLETLFNHPRAYLNRNSPAEFLRFVLPGLIDDSNSDALHSTEVEYGFWNDPEIAREGIFKALDKIDGFQTARLTHDVKKMAELYKAHVINYITQDKTKYPWNGQYPYFAEVGGLGELMGYPRKFLSRRNSPAALLGFALSELVEQSNPDALRLDEIVGGQNYGVSAAEYFKKPSDVRNHAQLSSRQPVDGAMEVIEPKNGGIDMNPAQMSMRIKKNGEDFKFDFNGAVIDAVQVTGVTFIIRNITPVINLPVVMGLKV
jgi:hypothetical protein